MTTRTNPSPTTRAPLSRERVLRAAVDLADESGIDSLSMRKLGGALGVEAMSLYNHVRSKDDILDGIVDAIVAEIEMPPPGDDWKVALRQQIMAARQVLLAHPWAPRVIESRPDPGPATLAYMESVIRILREGGFELGLAHHAMHVLGSRILGFNQELFDDTAKSGPPPEVAAVMALQMRERYPYVSEMAAAASHEGGLGDCDDDVEFAFGLDLILDGFERLRTSGSRPGS